MKHSADSLYQTLCAKHFIIAGPCVLESFSLAQEVAFALKEAAEKAGVFAIFKSSYDKANRTSLGSFRGPGIHKGLEWLAQIRQETGLPVLTDIHTPEEAAIVAEHADILQIPAFLCRQTSLLQAAGETNAIINIKKGQFLAPWDMQHVCDKVTGTGNKKIMVTERGTCFGYNNLVVDMRSFTYLNKLQVPSVIDATHSVQIPGGQGTSSGGDRTFVPAIARAAVAAGAHSVFLECHPIPDKALCDGPNSLELAKLESLLEQLAAIWRITDAN